MRVGWSRDELVVLYRWVRGEHGEKAQSATWLTKNGFAWLVKQMTRMFGSWDESKIVCGFDDPLYKRLSNEKIVQSYREVMDKFGDDAKNSAWVQKNFPLLHSQMYRRFGTWEKSMSSCGCDLPIESTYTRYRWSDEKIRIAYREVRRIHGDEAQKVEWMMKNGFAGLYIKMRKRWGSWKSGKASCGFREEPFHHRGRDLDSLVKEYHRKIKCPRSGKWMIKNGKGWLHGQLSKEFGGIWQRFLDYYNFSYDLSEEDLDIKNA